MTFRWLEPECENLLTGAGGAIHRHIEDLTIRVHSTAQAMCPKRHGQLAASLDKDTRSGGDLVTGRVYSTSPVAWFVEKGTGLFGPEHRIITPNSSRFLGPIDAPYPRFLRFTRGMRAQPFLERALRTAQPYPVTKGRD